MKTFALIPTNGRKSFGKKCHVNQYEVEGETHSDLISYGKRVAYYNHTENYITVHGWFSATTAIHINTFLEFYGFDKMTKDEMNAKKQTS